jgi:hypothetical protein
MGETHPGAAAGKAVLTPGKSESASHTPGAHPATHENRMRDRATWERARLARISAGFRNSMAFAGGTPAVPGHFRSSPLWAYGAPGDA